MLDDKKPKSPSPRWEDWREIAERASNETDPKKLIQLVRQLCDVLDQHEAKGKPTESPESPTRFTGFLSVRS